VISFEAFNLFNLQRITGLNTLTYTAVAVLPARLANGPYSGVPKPIMGAAPAMRRRHSPTAPRRGAASSRSEWFSNAAPAGNHGKTAGPGVSAAPRELLASFLPRGTSRRRFCANSPTSSRLSHQRDCDPAPGV